LQLEKNSNNKHHRTAMRCILRRSIFESTKFRVTITKGINCIYQCDYQITLINILCSLCNSSFSRGFNALNVTNGKIRK